MSKVTVLVKKIKPLFRAGVMPPFVVVNETLRRGEIDLGMSGSITWDPIDITENDYDIVKSEMALGDLENELPSWVDSFENWDIYQYQITHNIPADKHFELVQQEREISDLREKYLKEGDQEKADECLEKLMDISDQISDFLDQYFNTN